jgi:hypothetical protein
MLSVMSEYNSGWGVQAYATGGVDCNVNAIEWVSTALYLMLIGIKMMVEHAPGEQEILCP